MAENPSIKKPRELTEAQKKTNKDPLYWDWFDAWWEKDFSWDGLAKKTIEGWADGRTLQDYWREEQDKLIPFAGREWSRFHRPPHDPSGEKTSDKFEFDEDDWKKPKWQAWYAAITQKLVKASEFTEGEPDNRAQFTGICFPARFSLATPEDETAAQKQALHIRADWAQFGDWADFTEAQFGDETNFTKAQFGDEAIFSKAQFGARASFTEAQFGDWANFPEAQFGNMASFTEAQFGDFANFTKAKFGYFANFTKAQFGDMANFTEAQFGDMASFTETQFRGICFFTGIATEAAKRAIQQVRGLSFWGVHFYDHADFTDRSFPKGTNFSNAHFHKLAKFHGCTFHANTNFAEARFSPPPPAPNWLDVLWLRHYGVTQENIDETLEKNGTTAERYQNAFQTLRQHMETLRNQGQEMKFARLEAKARERRVGSTDFPAWARILSRVYGFICDYGQSVWRPLVGLAVSWGAASLVYAFIGGGLHHWADGMGVAAQFALPPISTFSAGFFESETITVFEKALLDHPFLTRAVMFLHGVFSAAMVFFLLLALKRRFQIR